MSSADRIVAKLRKWIGNAAPGAQLPPTRALAEQFSAGPVTVQKAIRTLAALGLVESRPGAGTFVLGTRPARTSDYGWQTSALRTADSRPLAPSSPMREPAPETLSLHSGYPTAELLPEGVVRSALSRASRTDASMSRTPANGLPDLRAWFAGELAASTPSGLTAPSPQDVIIVPGTQSSLSSIFRSLAGHGRPVLMESPTYWGAIVAAKQAGVEIVPVPAGADGPDPDDVSLAFAESGARLFYAQPAFANPTGTVWSPATRERILAVVRNHGAFLVEDDWAHDFAIDEAPTPLAARDDTGHVIYIRSLTKSVSPAIRVGALIARGPVRQRLAADRAAESMYVSGVLQAAALDAVLQPAWRTHLRRLRTQLAQRRDLLARSMAEHVPEAVLAPRPRGGLNLWARLPEDVDAERLVGECESAGVFVAAGDEWFPTDSTGVHLRLNFAGPDPSRFPEAAATIGRVLRQHLDRPHE